MSTFLFSREQRLLTPFDYSQVFAQPKKFHTPLFMAFVRPSQKQYPRLGLAVAKKKVKKAIRRNLIKRITRESFRLHQVELPHIDIVILTKNGADTVENRVLFAQLEQLWQKICRYYNIH